MKPSEEDLTILRAVKVSGAVTHKEVQPMVPEVKNLEVKMASLYSRGFLDRQLVQSKPTIYLISAKGRRHAKEPEVYVGHVAEPRRIQVMHAPAYVPPKVTPARVGADDHLAIKSRGIGA